MARMLPLMPAGIRVAAASAAAATSVLAKSSGSCQLAGLHCVFVFKLRWELLGHVLRCVMNTEVFPLNQPRLVPLTEVVTDADLDSP